MSEDRTFAPRAEINSEKTFAPRPEIKDLREFAKRTMDRHEDMQAATRRQASNNRDVEIKRTYTTSEPPKGFAAQPQKIRKNAPQVAESVAAVESGAFFGMTTVVSGGADNGDIYLQGGQVSAGTGNESFDNATILLFDQSANAGEGAWMGEAGEILELIINGTGSEVDDVLMPTFDLTSVPTPAAAPSLGTNTLPEVGALTGLCRVSLGTFTADGFSPANVGNIQASFCFGGFTVSRF